MSTELWESTSSLIAENRLSEAIFEVEARLQSLGTDRFVTLIGRPFTNTPDSVAEAIAAFITSQSFRVGAAYLEMNGFDINPGRWFFDFFAYSTFQGHDDLDWLSDWESPSWPDVTLTGLEDGQADFEWFMNQEDIDPIVEEAQEVAILLVMCRFMQLIASAFPLIAQRTDVSFTLLATTHDSDTILCLAA